MTESRLETVNRKLAETVEQKKRLTQQEKILRHTAQDLTRKQRTNRLCTRGGMLESFLGCPEDMSNDQILDLLKLAFAQPAVADLLKQMLSEKPQPDGSNGNP